MAVISVEALTKRFGSVHAVEGLSFEAPEGKVTGFLGPNGAGKTTTLRALLGLVRPTSGQALIGGRPYERLGEPWRIVGAVLDEGNANPGRTGRDQLRVLASAMRLPAKRADEVLELVDLTEAGRRRVSGYSTGMRQRLGLASALLGDPEVLVLDEPANGLDPEGIAWLRNLLRGFAADGRTILVSSHVLSEVAQTVDRVVIIGGGSLRFAGSLAELGEGVVSVRSADAPRLLELLRTRGFDAGAVASDRIDVRGATADQVGRLATDAQIALSGLADGNASLEAAFLRLTGGDALSGKPAGPRARRVAAN